ncbi:hypothetical protein B0T18DRAFT_38457 [Schizothecium vesticola]|uniref:Uncharacterized protein n=1 Tax=Schizothecium vesticola TaxID=314040 RepID=A0AA40FBF0_9PEZI|nr:hypothetical protein B0T18DRAFT_38457 [Schizothecium vesticola]
MDGLGGPERAVTGAWGWDVGWMDACISTLFGFLCFWFVFCFFLGLMGWNFFRQVLCVSSLSCPGWGWHCMGIGWFGKRGGAPRIRRGRLGWRFDRTYCTHCSIFRKKKGPVSVFFSLFSSVSSSSMDGRCGLLLTAGIRTLPPLCFSPWAGIPLHSAKWTDAAVDRYG